MKTEPALLMGLVTAGIALAASFGFNLTANQVGAISAFASAVLAVVVRQHVTPVG